jgi:hypothetical protein
MMEALLFAVLVVLIMIYQQLIKIREHTARTRALVFGWRFNEKEDFQA